MIEKKRKVLIIVENLPVPHDRRVWQESISLNNNGYEVIVICPKGKGYTKSYEYINGVHIYRHPLPMEARKAIVYIAEYTVAFFWEALLALKIFIKHGFDVIQACNPPDTIVFIALFYKLLFRRKFVFDHHDGNPEIWLAKGGKRNIVFKMLLALEKITFRVASISFAVNDPYKNIAVKRGGMNENDVFIVRNSPKLEDFNNAYNRCNLRSVSNNEKIIVGYLGVMGKQDSVDILIQAVEYIVNNKGRTDLLFQLMGDGPELYALKKLTSDLNLDKYITFTGWISGDDYYRYMSRCDICVNSDIVSEYNNFCSPNKVYEYMLFSKPFVQFEMTENKHIAGDASLYAVENDIFDMADKIIALADDPEKRIAMGKAGRKRLEEKFTWEKSSEALISAYDYLFEKKDK